MIYSKSIFMLCRYFLRRYASRCILPIRVPIPRKSFFIMRFIKQFAYKTVKFTFSRWKAEARSNHCFTIETLRTKQGRPVVSQFVTIFLLKYNSCALSANAYIPHCVVVPKNLSFLQLLCLAKYQRRLVNNGLVFCDVQCTCFTFSFYHCFRHILSHCWWLRNVNIGIDFNCSYADLITRP